MSNLESFVPGENPVQRISEEIATSNYWTIKAMDVYGGSFVRALAAAAWLADYYNLEKIKKTWPEYWENYRGLGEGLSKKDPSDQLPF